MRPQQYRSYGMEFSKKILVTSYIIAILFTIYVCFLAIIGRDIDALSNIVIVCWGEVAASNCFYYNKSKMENKLKIMIDSPAEIRDRVIDKMDINN